MLSHLHTQFIIVQSNAMHIESILKKTIVFLFYCLLNRKMDVNIWQKLNESF